MPDEGRAFPSGVALEPPSVGASKASGHSGAFPSDSSELGSELGACLIQISRFRFHDSDFMIQIKDSLWERESKSLTDFGNRCKIKSDNSYPSKIRIIAIDEIRKGQDVSHSLLAF